MAVNLFADLGKPAEQLHPQFLSLKNHERFRPARQQLEELQQSFDDPDGNFVEQFQTSGFDPRTFELFLFAMLKEAGHTIDRSHQRPDFLVSKGDVTAAVEAVTASVPAVGGVKPYFAIPAEKTGEELIAHLQHSVPIRLGSPLFSKLKQQYWLEPHVAGRPLILAIQDFSGPGSLMTTSTPLARYLFGIEQHWYTNADGKLVITEHPVHEHVVGQKKIPSGFFQQPGAENISAVLFCNTGTVPKFARMGQEGKYNSKAVRMLRAGVRYFHNPDADMPAPFAYEVAVDKQFGPESWRQGTVLLRNPNAVHPLAQGWLGAAVEESLVEGKSVVVHTEEFLPFYSMTQMFPGNAPDKHIQAFKAWAHATLGQADPALKKLASGG